MKDFDNTVNNVNKIGGGKSDSLISLRARIKRLTEHGCAWLAAFFVSALWCLLTLPLTFASCTEAIPFNTSQNPDTYTRTDSTGAATDSTGSFTGEILDWEEGKSEPLIPAKGEKGGTL